MASEITKVGEVFLVKGREYKLAGYRLVSNMDIMGNHELTFTITVEAPTEYVKRTQTEPQQGGW